MCPLDLEKPLLDLTAILSMKARRTFIGPRFNTGAQGRIQIIKAPRCGAVAWGFFRFHDPLTQTITGETMNPETKFEQIRRALIAMLLTLAMLPILGLWAAASGIETVIRKIKGA